MTESTNRPVRVRVAPSPTGDPHVGTGYIALFNYAFAKANRGKFIMRIEDTDRERSNTESERQILHSLRWLGLEWDEGPDVGGPHSPYRQSERGDIYRKCADELVAKGAAYPCFCRPERLAELREQQRARKLDMGYDGHCKRKVSRDEARARIAAGERHVIRLDVPDEGETVVHDFVRGDVVFRNSAIDDQVLLKSDGFPTYHLANVVDDHLMGITHVIRAEEWITSTPKHLLLYQTSGWQPPTFIHMPLLRNADKTKISKRKDPTSLLWYEEQGYLPEALRNFLALMGWCFGDDREVFSLQEMINEFSWDRVAKSAPVFDFQKLDWLNGEYIRDMSERELAERLRATVLKDHPADDVTLLKTIPLVQERLKKLSDYGPLTEFLFADEVHPAIEDLIPKKSSAEEAAMCLEKAHDALGQLSDWTVEAMEKRCRALVDELHVKVRTLFMALRVAVTGTRVSPPLFESMEILGRDKSLARIAAARDDLAG